MSYKEYTVKVYDDGTKKWWLNGKRHREDGPACEYANGAKEWRLNDKLHREDGPACEYADGAKNWYLNDKLHREDGPAVEHADGAKNWYLNDVKLTEQEFNERMNPDFCDGKVVEIEGRKYKLSLVSK